MKIRFLLTSANRLLVSSPVYFKESKRLEITGPPYTANRSSKVLALRATRAQLIYVIGFP
jgi:hypothetical protein